MWIEITIPRNTSSSVFCSIKKRCLSARISTAYEAVPLFGSFHSATAYLATLRTTALFSRYRKDRPVNSVIEKMLLIAKRNAFLLLHSHACGLKLIIRHRSDYE